MSVAVLTTCIPERLDMLARNMESVRTQTQPPREHLVSVDYERVGHHHNANRLGNAATSDRLLWLADDDELLPTCLEQLSARDADIVYSNVQVEGSEWHPGDHDFDASKINDGHGNYIPATALIRAELWRDLGGWPIQECEDWAFWKKAVLAGATFERVPEKLWVYHFHATNRSRSPDARYE